MQQDTETEETKLYYTDKIRFWSTNELASSAYDRIEELRSQDQTDKAALILSDWIL